jgi:hypothetical protein
MCTVSIIPLPEPGGYRLMTNRDEHRERAEALPPRWHEVRRGEGASRALWPTDAAAGGTWVASSEHGLTLTLLNLNLRSEAGESPARFGGVSRGLVIPRLIGCGTPEEAAEALGAMDVREFLPFRLIAVGPGVPGGRDGGRARIVECRSDGRSVAVARHDGSPICFVSSGLGDRLVEPRLGLFERMVVARGATAEAQDEFHAHVWPDRPQVSVMMSRTDARTVSVCRVEARPGTPWAVRMDYQPVPEAAASTVTVPGQARAYR